MTLKSYHFLFKIIMVKLYFIFFHSNKLYFKLSIVKNVSHKLLLLKIHFKIYHNKIFFIVKIYFPLVKSYKLL